MYYCMSGLIRLKLLVTGLTKNWTATSESQDNMKRLVNKLLQHNLFDIKKQIAVQEVFNKLRTRAWLDVDLRSPGINMRDD